MNVSKELFVIPSQGGQYRLFAPLRAAVLDVNEDTIRLLQMIRKGEDITGIDIPQALLDSKIVSEDKLEDRLPQRSLPTEITAIDVTLMPTSDCNLRCVYCYGNGGETHLDLDPKIGFAAIDFIVENALRKNVKGIGVGFHGGGEPFFGRTYSNVQAFVAHAKEVSKAHELKLNLQSATNGNLGDEKLSYIVKNFDRVMLSIDGPEDIQDAQRPPFSFEEVMHTIAFFEQHEFPYGIRATITDQSVERMEEIVDFFADNTSVKRFHLEPLSECGRCYQTGIKAPENGKFIENFLKAYQRAHERGVEIHNSACRFESVSDRFCGAAGSNFFITPEGYVSSCLEVNLKSDPRSVKFFYGQFDAEQGSFTFDIQKLQYLASRSLANIPYCNDCVARYSCGGGCLAKVESATGDMYHIGGSPSCELQKKFTMFKMDEVIANK